MTSGITLQYESCVYESLEECVNRLVSFSLLVPAATAGELPKDIAPFLFIFYRRGGEEERRFVLNLRRLVSSIPSSAHRFR